jgi:hypothetical protein
LEGREVGFKERLAAVEAKLGIDPPNTEGPILVWDKDDILDGYVYPTRVNPKDGYDWVDDFEHFVYLTPEIVAAIKALPAGEK